MSIYNGVDDVDMESSRNTPFREQEGNYLLEVIGAGEKESRKQKGKFRYQLDAKVIESTNPAFPAGAVGSHVVFPDEYGYSKKEIMSIVAALLNEDVKTISEKTCRAADNNPELAGVRVRLSVSGIKTRTNGKGEEKEFRELSWFPVAPAEEPKKAAGGKK